MPLTLIPSQVELQSSWEAFEEVFGVVINRPYLDCRLAEV